MRFFDKQTFDSVFGHSLFSPSFSLFILTTSIDATFSVITSLFVVSISCQLLLFLMIISIFDYLTYCKYKKHSQTNPHIKRTDLYGYHKILMWMLNKHLKNMRTTITGKSNINKTRNNNRRTNECINEIAERLGKKMLALYQYWPQRGWWKWSKK